MGCGPSTETNKQALTNWSPTPDKDDSWKNLYLPPDGKPTPETRPSLTEEQKTIIKETWQSVKKDIEKIGVIMFVQLFETHPDVQDNFADFRGQTIESLKGSVALKTHALRVMNSVDKVVSRLDQPQRLEALLHDLGRRHIGYRANMQFIDAIGHQFIFAIKPSLPDWSSEVEEAWRQAFRVIGHIMRETGFSGQS